MFRDSNARKVVPLMAAATAVTTVAATGAVDATPAPQVDDLGGLNAIAGLDTDGTYESCEAYFGFGKEEGFADAVAFDVEVQNPIDATTHTVGNGVDVVLVLENKFGDTIECVPFELTEEDWQETLDSVPFPLDLPDFPGPGHFVYPSVNFGPEIGGFGIVTEVGFRVVGVPDGLDLVAPTGVQPLEPGLVLPFQVILDGADPRVLDIIRAAAGDAAAASFDDAIAACLDEDPIVVDEALEDAVQALTEYIGVPGPVDVESCEDLFLLEVIASMQAGIEFVATYTEPISLAGPAPTTTAPSTTAAAAAAEAVRPRFTG